MRWLRNSVLCFLLLAATTGCSYMSPQAAKPAPAPQTYVESRDDCTQQADKKLSLFDRPDTYPISDEEKNNARHALYSECMKGHGVQMAGAGAQKPQEITAKDLGKLSPAAGGKPPAVQAQNAGKPASVYNTPGGTVIILQPQDAPAAKEASGLAALSPSAGGKQPPEAVASAYPGATVVVVQGAPSAPPAQPVPRPALPVAVPVPVPPSAATTPAPSAAGAVGQKTAAREAPPEATDPATRELERMLAQ